MKTSYFAAAALAIVGAWSATAQAAPIAIINGSFDLGPVYGDGGFRAGHEGGNPIGWGASGGSGTGNWNPTAAAFADHEAHGMVAFTSSTTTNGTTSTGALGQTLQGMTLEANMRYTLTLDVGNSAQHTFDGYHFGLVAGDMAGSTPGDFILASLSGLDDASGNPIPDGEFRTLSLVFETTKDSLGLGSQISIFIGSLAKTFGSGVAYDNVSFDATALDVPTEVPEPATLGLLGLGLLGLAAGRRKRA